MWMVPWLSIHIGDYKSKSPLSFKIKNLEEINISFTSHCIKQQNTIEYTLVTNLSLKQVEKLSSLKLPQQVNVKLKCLYIYKAFTQLKTISQCPNTATFP